LFILIFSEYSISKLARFPFGKFVISTRLIFCKNCEKISRGVFYP